VECPSVARSERSSVRRRMKSACVFFRVPAVEAEEERPRKPLGRVKAVGEVGSSAPSRARRTAAQPSSKWAHERVRGSACECSRAAYAPAV